MRTKEFETELQKIDEGFSIIDNPNRPGLANIYYRGKNYDLPVLSSFDIKDEPDPKYRYEFPNGTMARFWAKSEIMPRLEQFLVDFKGGKFEEIYD